MGVQSMARVLVTPPLEWKLVDLLIHQKPSEFVCVQCSKLKFFRSHLLATSLCKMVATTINLVAKIKSCLKKDTLFHFTWD